MEPTVQHRETGNERFEKGPGIREGLKDFSKHLNAKTITAGTVAAVFGCTGPALLVINAATNGGLSQVQAISWLFSIYFFGGLISIFLALRYKQPINGAYSIPAAVMMISAMNYFSVYEAAGAYFIAGLIVLVLGFSGLIAKVMRWLPLPVVMAMIAGAMIRFGTGIITSTEAMPIMGAAALAGFLILPRLTKKIPPVLGALLLGIIAAAFSGGLDWSNANYAFVAPQLLVPQFSLDALLSIAIPLAILVIGAENAQAAGVLMAQDYKPPINAMTIVSGLGGMVTAFFGGHNANIAGPMTAICSSEEAGDNKEGRYVASVINGVLFGGFGLLASLALAFVSGLPKSLIGIVAGLAMIGVLLSAFQEAFAPKKFKTGAFFALIIAMSGITIFKVSAPFWALVGGVVVSYLTEPQDFQRTE
ncbi:benzoate/H(+) symporter BenE family transporter [Metallumcola ferriviriculae]|uniref:Benzoate/H(+) symporter BenE family transporter n=1 Tax=Metallumcola ferriviriculae TaxID=3039180 RepID=A0AAU0UNV7_9FIRM|nr:benzoate/H(+) symporter BenE family transporter [Desulfitibacteraceae bacterium MK1]